MEDSAAAIVDVRKATENRTTKKDFEPCSQPYPAVRRPPEPGVAPAGSVERKVEHS